MRRVDQLIGADIDAMFIRHPLDTVSRPHQDGTDNTLFGRINGSPQCGFAARVGRGHGNRLPVPDPGDKIAEYGTGVIPQILEVDALTGGLNRWRNHLGNTRDNELAALILHPAVKNNRSILGSFSCDPHRYRHRVIKIN